MVESRIGVELDETLVQKYFKTLVNKIFKILPIIENSEESIIAYMESLGRELAGFKGLLPSVGEDPLYLQLLAIYEWIYENSESAEENYKAIRSEVFHAISVCKKLEEQTSVVECEVV